MSNTIWQPFEERVFVHFYNYISWILWWLISSRQDKTVKIQSLTFHWSSAICPDPPLGLTQLPWWDWKGLLCSFPKVFMECLSCLRSAVNTRLMKCKVAHEHRHWPLGAVAQSCVWKVVGVKCSLEVRYIAYKI